MPYLRSGRRPVLVVYRGLRLTRDIRRQEEAVNLVVHVPCDATEESERALGLARQAPTFAVEYGAAGRMAVAIFPSLPVGIDVAVDLVGESVRVPGAWASVNTKPISWLAKLWQRLICYRDSLSAPDPVRYCRERAAHFHELVGCEGHRCPVSCQFICQPCLLMPQDAADRSLSSLAQAAEAAEIAWCPRLMLPAAQLIVPVRIEPV